MMDEKEKPQYEPPALIDLGEIARGDGCCQSGSGNTRGHCTQGWSAAWSPDEECE